MDPKINPSFGSNQGNDELRRPAAGADELGELKGGEQGDPRAKGMTDEEKLRTATFNDLLEPIFSNNTSVPKFRELEALAETVESGHPEVCDVVMAALKDEISKVIGSGMTETSLRRLEHVLWAMRAVMRVQKMFESIVDDGMQIIIFGAQNQIPQIFDQLCQIYKKLCANGAIEVPVGNKIAKMILESIECWSTKNPYKGYADIARSEVISKIHDDLKAFNSENQVNLAKPTESRAAVERTPIQN